MPQCFLHIPDYLQRIGASGTLSLSSLWAFRILWRMSAAGRETGSLKIQTARFVAIMIEADARWLIPGFLFLLEIQCL